MNYREILESGSIPEGMNAMFVTLAPNAPSAEYAALGGLSCAQWGEQALIPGSRSPNITPIYGALATTEHAASSYGLPVVVLADGTPVGPGDRVYRDLSFVVLAAAANPMFSALRTAGHTVIAEEI